MTVTIQELLARTEKINQRVSAEWDRFTEKHGGNWDGLSEEAKKEACVLSERQAERWMKQVHQHTQHP